MSRPHNRPIATGDFGVGKTPAPSQLSEQGVLQFGKHKGKTLSEAPVDYLKWIRREGVLNDNKHREALDDEFRRRKHSPQTKPVRELVAGMGGVLFGKYEGQNIGGLSKFQLKDLIATPNITERSKARIQTLLKKKQRQQRRRKKKRSKK